MSAQLDADNTLHPMDHLTSEIINIDLVSVEEHGVDCSIKISFLWYFDTSDNLEIDAW